MDNRGVAARVRRRRASALLTTDPKDLPVIGLGSKYAKLLGFDARNWASSAKAGGGTDTTLRVRITDNRGAIVYLDAADTNYTAGVKRIVVADDTATGLSTSVVDQTGAAAAAGEAAGAGIIMESPVTVRVTLATTATDFFEIDLFVEG